MYDSNGDRVSAEDVLDAEELAEYYAQKRMEFLVRRHWTSPVSDPFEVKDA